MNRKHEPETLGQCFAYALEFSSWFFFQFVLLVAVVAVLTESLSLALYGAAWAVPTWLAFGVLAGFAEWIVE